MSWGDDVYAAWLRNQPGRVALSSPAPAQPLDPKDGYKSKLERQYAGRLQAEQYGGLVLRWAYEPFKLRLARTCFYTPDFLVIYSAHPGVIELHETKGYWREESRVKTKVAAQQHPWFRFKAVQYDHGVWRVELILPATIDAGLSL